MKRFFADRGKTSPTIGCNHTTDVSPESKGLCIYQPIYTIYSLPQKPLYLFPEVCQILHKSKNTENLSATIKNSCHTCGRLSHFGGNPNETCGRLSHFGESSNESCGRFSHFGESSNESCGRLSHFGESLNENFGSFSPICEQNYGYISLKV